MMSEADFESEPKIEQVLDDYRVAVFVMVVTISYLAGSLQVYGFCLFKRNKQLLIIQRRYPQLVMMESFACIIGLFISQPLEFNTDIAAVRFSSSALDTFISYFGLVMLSYTNYFIMIIETLRLWLISYDLHYLSSSQNEQWKSQIDVSYADKDWYLRNRGKWGSERYAGKYAVMYFLFCSNVHAILKIVILDSNPRFMWIHNCINKALSFPAVFTVFYVYFKTPKCLQDELLFHYEFKRTMIIWGTGFVFYTIANSLEFLEYHRLSVTLTTLVLICSLYAPSLLVRISPQLILLQSFKILMLFICSLFQVDSVDPA